MGLQRRTTDRLSSLRRARRSCYRSAMELLQYRAGARALERLRRRGGLSPSDISAVVLPAIGPKWLALYGIDRALIDHGWYEASGRARRLLLFGASAGAWRGLAITACDPSRALDALRDAYCDQHFTRQDSPSDISGAYRRMLESVCSAEDFAHTADHPSIDLAIATVRARGLLAVAHRPALPVWQRMQRRGQAAALGAAALLNALSPRMQRLFFERVVFRTSAGRDAEHALIRAAPGRLSALTPNNMLEAALASGTVPLYMQSVRDIPQAPRGWYLDGGFSDYHLNRPAHAEAGITVLFLHQRRIVPTWVDKFLPWRAPARGDTRDLLLVHPSEAFVRELPGGGVPTRHDFERMLHTPELRVQRWREVSDRSRALGEALVRDAQTGALISQLQPL